jgi:hypothetical protein
MCGWMGNGMPARSPRREISVWKLFGVIGPPRSEALMGYRHGGHRRRIHRLRMARGRTVAPAVVRRAQVRPALDHLSRNLEKSWAARDRSSRSRARRADFPGRSTSSARRRRFRSKCASKKFWTISIGQPTNPLRQASPLASHAACEIPKHRFRSRPGKPN